MTTKERRAYQKGIEEGRRQILEENLIRAEAKINQEKSK